MRIQKIIGDILPYLQKMSLPITDGGEPELYRWLQTPKLSDEMIEKCIAEMPWLLWELAEQAFYQQNLGEESCFHTIMVNSLAEFELQKDALPLLFHNVIACRVHSSLKNERLWEVQVKGISGLGSRVLEKRKLASCLPPELTDLYWNQGFASDCKEKALFAVTIENTAEETIESTLFEPSLFMKDLMKTSFFHSIDLSSLTLRQCAKHALVRYIVCHKKEVYLLSLDYSEAKQQGPFTKRLYWA